MNVFQRVQGMLVTSRRALPDVPTISAAEPADLDFDCIVDVASDGFPSRQSDDWRPVSVSSYYDAVADRGVQVLTRVSGDGGSWLLVRFAHAMPAECLVTPDGRHAIIFWAGSITRQDEGMWPRDLASLFLGPVIALIARRLGRVPLHAAGVATDAGAVLILGPRGAGKSTLLAALAARGAPVVSDEVAVLSSHANQIRVAVAPEGPRLWPEALARLGFDADRLPRVWSIGAKRMISGYGRPDAAESVALARVVLLAPRGGAAVPRLGIVPKFTIFHELWQSLHPAFQPATPEERPMLVAVLGRIAMSVPVQQLHRPDGLDALAESCDLVLGDW